MEKRLIALKPDKSPGPDKIHPRVLRELASQVAYPLYIIFKKSLSDSELPASWKLGHIHFFKKGYRYVSLTSVVCKTLEHLVRADIMKHMWENKLLSDYQHGFVEDRSCTSQLLAVLEAWTRILDSGNAVDAIYLDFRKDFDTVPHKRLLPKLEGYGVTGKYLTWINAFLDGRKQRVIINGEESPWKDVTSGIPQGSVVGPVLFVIFINDPPDVMKQSVQMFADDTKMWSKISNLQDCVYLQEDIDKLQEWSKNWLVAFTATKCKIMRLRNNQIDYQYKMGENKLAEIISEKDLGIYIDNKLRLSDHVDAAVNKANRLVGLIKR